MYSLADDPTPAIRRARPDDLGAVVALIHAAGLPTDGVTGHLDDFLVADLDGQLVGTAGLERYGEHALLRSVAVRADQRGRRLGEALVHAILERARSLRCHDVWLLTTTAEDWFPRFGFRPATRDAIPPALFDSAELRGACPESARVLRITFD